MLQRGRGCRQCNETGYRGRFAIHEMLPITREQIRLILLRSSTEELHEKALEEGMAPLLQEGLRRIMNGETTVEEVIRVAYSGVGVDEPVFEPAVPAGIALSGTTPQTVPAIGEEAAGRR